MTFRFARRMLLAAALCAAAAGASRAEDADPLATVRDAIEKQDKAVMDGKDESLVADARERVKDGTPESWYLLGRALGMAAVRKLAANQRPEASRLLDDANEAFLKSKEVGGLLYAPAHLGLARVALVRSQVDESPAQVDRAIEELRAALRVSKNFKEAVIELAQTLWEKKLTSDAELQLVHFLELSPGDADARLLLGLFKLKRGRYAEAEPELRAVLEKQPRNVQARKLLAADLMFQEKWKESAEHFETARAADPKDDEPYMTLFNIYRRTGEKEKATALLRDATTNLPGTEVARRAKSLLDELQENPTAWEAPPETSPETLVKRLDSLDPKIVQETLEQMRKYPWTTLPRQVYENLLLRDAGSAPRRLAAVRLIGDVRDPQTLTILEILLQHPSANEREADSQVRKEVAHALSRLPTPAIVPILMDALDDTDPEVREWAVQGIADRTGKSFRVDLSVPTPAKDWPQELDCYRRWWGSASASSVKRDAARALLEIYGRVERGSKVRVSRYAMPALEDGNETTWRAGYDLFRALTVKTFGSEQGEASAEDRKRVATQARAWLEEQLKGPKK